MKNLGNFKRSLLMSAVALSLFSSPTTAVSEEVVKKYIAENSAPGKNVPPQVLSQLVKLNDTQWEQFQRIAQSLIAPDMYGVPRENVITCLAAFSPELHNEKFSSLFESLIDQRMSLPVRINMLICLQAVPTEKLFHSQFSSVLKGFDISNMTEIAIAHLIICLAPLKPETLFHEGFVSLVKGLAKPEINGLDYTKIICAFHHAKPERLFHEGFLTTADHLLRQNMDEEKRLYTISALSQVEHPETAFNDKFVSAIKSLIGPNMTGQDICSVMVTLGRVEAYKAERVYSQIERFLSETQGKIQMTRRDTICGFIGLLMNSIDDISDQSSLFTTSLIQLVNNHEGYVNDDALLTHMNTAWDRVGGASQNELQELARQSQSTHKKEVHASVAESVKRLQEKYKDHLPQGDVFELVYKELKSVFPPDMRKKFKEAKAAAIKLVGKDAIDNLLKISPHARAGENDEDTALNVAARALKKDKPPEIQSAIQELAYYHSHKNDLTDAEKLLKTIKENTGFKDGISQIGYEPLLRLIYAAITDESWGDGESDIPGRWRTLLTRMVRAQNEYRPQDQACLAGIFNALLEPLSGVHTDVRIIPSFRLMMQDIALEEDDAKFNERIDIALSFLGENARKDRDYMQVLADVTDARMDRQLQNAKDIEALEKLKADLTALKDTTDEDFEAAAAALAKALPESLQEQKLLWNTLIVQARKARAENQSGGTTSAGSSDEIEPESTSPAEHRRGLAPSPSPEDADQ